MNILFLARSLNVGGAQRQLTLLARELKTRGCNVSVAVFYGGGTLHDELTASGVPVIDLRKQGRWSVVLFWLRLLAAMRRTKPHVVYAYLSVPNILTVLNKPFFPGTRVVWGVRASGLDTSHYHWTLSFLGRVESVLSRFADLVICNSNAGLEHGASQGFVRERMVVIDNGIDTIRFQPDAASRAQVRMEWGIAPDQPLVGLVARLDPMKDHPTFLQAAALIARERDDVRFVCVGDGPAAYREDLVARARALGIDGRLLWVGSRSDMPAVYCAMDVVCSSSAFGEGFSNSVAEAMASGVPCVVTDVGDSARVVGDTGVVVPVADPAAVSSAVQRLLREGGVDAERRQDVRQRIVSKFGVEALARATLLELERLVQDRGAAVHKMERL